MRCGLCRKRFERSSALNAPSSKLSRSPVILLEMREGRPQFKSIVEDGEGD